MDPVSTPTFCSLVILLTILLVFEEIASHVLSLCFAFTMSIYRLLNRGILYSLKPCFRAIFYLQREKGRYLNQPYDKSIYTIRK